jgi:CBS domain-containing protein
MQDTLVRDWMTPAPVCASLKTTLPQAERLMKEHRIRRLPVVHKDKLVGIVTWGDVRGAAPSEVTSLNVFELNYLLDHITLDRVMTPNPVSVAPDTTIGEAARLMLTYRISGLPVVEGDRIVGIVTESDIFRLVARQWTSEGREVRAQV